MSDSESSQSIGVNIGAAAFSRLKGNSSLPHVTSCDNPPLLRQWLEYLLVAYTGASPVLPLATRGW
jgi:hypothetical protein